jgi:alpha-amylase
MSFSLPFSISLIHKKYFQERNFTASLTRREVVVTLAGMTAIAAWSHQKPKLNIQSNFQPHLSPYATMNTSDSKTPKAINGTIMQYFHWYLPNDGNHWKQVAQKAQAIAHAGFTALWLPPAYKGSSGSNDVGYGVYDIFDLGEFNQKDTIRTKYGTKDEYLAAIQALKAAGVHTYADTVFNHKDGGDEKERIRAVPYRGDDRTHPAGNVRDIEAYTAFNFPGRGDRYSSMKWNRNHFDSVNHDMISKSNDLVYLFEGQGFEKMVDLEKGNYDFLLGCDLDMDNLQVQGELMYWGRWMLEMATIEGFRLDAVKHIPAWFFKLWLEHVRNAAKKNLFCMGEYWSDNLSALRWYIDETGGSMSLFDVPLHQNFHRASLQGSNYDLRKILDGTLMQADPIHAVTFVENHDTQTCQALESTVEPWFKPLAYAMILLRAEGYPCVFYPDYYGAEYPNCRGGYPVVFYSHQFLIDRFLKARQENAYGPQYTYFDHPNCIGWTRLGDTDHPKAMAVVMSNGNAGHKWMEVGKKNAKFVDRTGHCTTSVTTNAHGWGDFTCPGGSVSVWVEV